MTDKEIIKALECCGKPVDENSCSECPYHCYEEDCHKLLPQAIDLINRQQAEIERLNSPVLIIDNVDLSENEIAEKLRNLPVQIFPDNEEQIRNEAIKEFAERLKNATLPIRIGGQYNYDVISKQGIDHILKEMVGDAE